MEVIVHEPADQEESFKQYEEDVRQQIFNHRLQDELQEQIYPHLRGEPGHNYAFRNLKELNLVRTDLSLRLQTTISRLEAVVRTRTTVERDAILFIAYRDFDGRFQRYRQFARVRHVPFA